jgi:hypothetical protein
MKIYNAKDIKLLDSYDPVNDADKTVFNHLKNAGLAFDPVVMTHDQLVDGAINQFSKTTKNSVANAFVIGLNDHLPQLRSALAAYAVMIHYKNHTFLKHEHHIACGICAGYEDFQKIDLTMLNRYRWSGTIIGNATEPDQLFFILREHNQLDLPEATETQVNFFIKFLEMISDADNEEKPLALVKRMRSYFQVKISTEDLRSMIDTLGYAGILQSKSHGRWIDKFHGYLTPRSSRSSDWAYPADFWRGSDGINMESVGFWFSNVPKIMRWVEQSQAASSPDSAMMHTNDFDENAQ